METFSALLALCAGNSPVTGEFPAQRPVTRSFDVFFDLRFNKRLSKQSWGWWFETPSRSLWRHCNAKEHDTPAPHADCSIVYKWAVEGTYVYLYMMVQSAWDTWVSCSYDNDSQVWTLCVCRTGAWGILGLRPANERRRYFVTTSLIGWAQT